SVIGARAALLIPALSNEANDLPTAAPSGPLPAATPAPAPAMANAGIAVIDAISSARGIVMIWPHFLQWPRLPAIRGSSSNRAPQLWQKNTMLIAPFPSLVTGPRSPFEAPCLRT